MNYLKALGETYNSFEWVVMGYMLFLLAIFIIFKIVQARRQAWKRNTQVVDRKDRDLQMSTIRHFYGKKA